MRPGPAWRIGGVLAEVLRQVFVTPVRAGRLRDTGWPRGLREVAVVALGLWVLLMVAGLGAAWWRRHDVLLVQDPDLSLPRLALPVVLTGLALAVSLLHVAALHLRGAAGWALCCVAPLLALDLVERDPMRMIDWITVVLAVLLVAMRPVRRRRPFHWLEVLLTLVLVGTVFALHLVLRLDTSASGTPPITLNIVPELHGWIYLLAIPVAVVAGAALVEIVTSVAVWTSREVAGAGGPRRWLPVLVGVLLIARVLQEVHRCTTSDPVPISALVTAGLWAVLLVVPPAAVVLLAPAARRLDAAAILGRWSEAVPMLALAVALALAVPFALMLTARITGIGVLDQLWDASSTPSGIVVLAMLGAMICLLLAGRAARRGDPVMVLAALAVATTQLLAAVAEWLPAPPRYDDLTMAIAVGAVLLTAVAALRGRWSSEALTALGGVLLLTGLYPLRDLVTEPLTAAIALTGTSAALLFGLVWRLLSDNGWTRADSVRLPQPSRVLLALASALMGASCAALVVLLGGVRAFDLGVLEVSGDLYLGFGLLVVVSGWWYARIWSGAQLPGPARTHPAPAPVRPPTPAAPSGPGAPPTR